MLCDVKASSSCANIQSLTTTGGGIDKLVSSLSTNSRMTARVFFGVHSGPPGPCEPDCIAAHAHP